MRFRLYREFGALNSPPIFNAFEQGLRSLGHEIVQANEDVAVIWSVLWAGRMLGNKNVYQSNKPTIIIEVGNLIRGTTWRISLNNINGLGEFGIDDKLDIERPSKLKLKLSPIQENRKSDILIASQHSASLQWQGMPNMNEWITTTVAQIRQHTNRKIKIRPHPRSPVRVAIPGVEVEVPKRIPGSYDDFDIDYNYHCVVNHNSGPAVQAAINGVPVVCDSSSLAGELSGSIANIESISLPDRTLWFTKLTHTEWTVEEISKGIPQARIISKISV
jgi:hypothetical protein